MATTPRGAEPEESPRSPESAGGGEAGDEPSSDADLILDTEALERAIGRNPFDDDPLAGLGEDGAWGGSGAGAEESKEDEPSRLDSTVAPGALEAATVARLREELGRLHVPDYKTDLERAARPEEITVGLLSPDEAAEREAALEDARLREAAREADRFARKEATLALRQARARSAVVGDKAAASAAVREQEMRALETRAEMEEAVRRAYREARAALALELRRQRAVVMERFGTVAPQPQGSLARARLARHSLSVSWSRVPQPLRVAVHQVRGVKDRLPRGRYSLLVTLWDRLGGRPLRWSRLAVGAGAGPYKGLARPAATRPVRHAGRFYDSELDFKGQGVHALTPAAADLAPSHTLVLELFLLGGKRSPVDRVVAWTALPCVDSDLRPVEGRFRLPLLRGEVDLDVDQYVKMERRWGTDLDAWLGNLYVEVTRVPREQIGDGGSLVGEYDVEVAYTSEVLRLRQARLREAEGGSVRKRKGRGGGASAEGASESGDEAWDGAGSDGDEAAASMSVSRGARPGAGLEGLGAAASSGRLGRSAAKLTKGGSSRRGRSGSRRRRRKHGGGEEAAGLLSSAWESDEDGEDAWAGGVAAAAGELRRGQGMGTVRHSVPGAARGRGAPAWSARPLASVASYGFAVSKQETRGIGRGRRLGESSRKGVYLRQELFGDLLPSTGGAGLCSVTAMLQLLVLLIALYVRGHVHYLGQWLLLQAQRIPVYELSLSPAALSLKYVGSVLPMELEMGVVVAGPLAVALFQVVLCLVCLLLFACFRHVPDVLSRFTAFFGVAAVLDPVLVFVLDLAFTNYSCSDPSIHPLCVPDFTARACRCFEGDAFKLYYRFLRTEGSGVIGVVLTLFVYAVIMVLAALVLYAFLLNLHLDGRMLDLYRRIHGPEGAFRTPHDLELSARELRWIVDKSRRWRSARGTMRRVAVCSYVLTDPLVPAFQEATSHLIIYHSDVDGSRELYRHFLRQPDGTVVEVFGDMESSIAGGRAAAGKGPTPLQRVLLRHAEDDDDAVGTLFGGL